MTLQIMSDADLQRYLSDDFLALSANKGKDAAGAATAATPSSTPSTTSTTPRQSTSGAAAAAENDWTAEDVLALLNSSDATS
jgi:hypothetical protein